MHAPGITRHRRPFLAPLWLTMLAVLLVGGAAVSFYRSATTAVVLLVQPLPKEPGTIDDPPLPPEGEQRAQQLARMFGDAAASSRLDAIYVSDDRRAQQTGEPLTQRLQRAPVLFHAGDARETAARVLREHPGGTVLLIASGAALPQIIHALGIAELPLQESQSEFLYVVSVPTFGRAHLVRIRL